MNEQKIIVAIDACVLINLFHVNRLDLCGHLHNFQFIIPDHVHAEITHSEQLNALDGAIAAGVFQLVSIKDPEDIELFSKLIRHIGRGEAACLVLAARNGWSIASDEKGRFQREAKARLGEERVIGTVDIYSAALRSGLLTIEQADADKVILAEQRFKMPFGSFHEIM